MNNLLKNKNKYIILILQILLPIIFFILWELLAYYNIIDEFLFSKPSSIYNLFITYFKTNNIFNHISISLIETVLGVLIGSILGLLIAIFLWYFDIIEKILNPFLVILNSLPKTALAPIFIIWVGTNMKGIIFVSISISLIITILNLLKDFKNTNKDQIKMLQTFEASKLQILRYLVLPSNIGNMIINLKISIGMTWIGVIVGEFIVSKEGLGYLIMYGSQVFRLDLVMLSVIILAILTLLMSLLIDLLYKIYIRERG